MYERFYNLRERPFALSPDPEYLYLSRVHSEALDYLRFGIESRAGFIVVTGEIGAGKTTLLQTLLQRLDDRAVIARVVNTMLDPRELLEAIALDFGLNEISASKPVLVRDLGLFLVEQRRQGRRPLVVIDEAQNLSPHALEEVRLLSNLETEKSKLLQIVLAGQPNLRDTIAAPELEQFRQRIAVSYHLMPLEPADTAAYINFRLEHAALGEPLRFPPDACSLIHQISGGVPRIINVVCDAVLVFGYAEERRSIDRALIDDVISELEETGIVRRTSQAGGAAAQPATVAATASVAAPVEMPMSTGVPAAIATTPLVAATAMPAVRPAAPEPMVADVARSRAPEPQRHEPSPVGSETAIAAKPTAPTSAISERASVPGRPAMLDSFWQRPAAAPAPSASLSAYTMPATAGAPPSRDVALAAGRDAARQTAQLPSEAILTEREELSRKQRDLAAREQAVMERERQIAEQRRIMSEEYRLMRQAQSAKTTATAAARPSVRINRSDRVDPSNGDRVMTRWQRLFRLLNWSPAVRS
jgi:putative secretion ATPase (PEP-CTERM system associated)